MTNQNLGSRVSLAGKLKSRPSWWLVAAGAVVLAVFSASIASAAGSPPNGIETPTPEPDATLFVGTIEIVDENCGDGTITLTVNPEGTGISAVVVVDFVVSGTASTQNLEFDPPIAIAGDGSFSNTGPLPPPLETIDASLVGVFDFGVDPATVSGTITIEVAGTPLCEADYTAEALAAGAPTPTVPAPVPTTAAVVPTSLPVTGTSVAPSTGGDGVLWATVAGIVAVFALSAAGAVAVRRRSA